MDLETGAKAATVLSAGTGGGHVRMYGPAMQEPGSSVSHFSAALSPDELMEPFFTGANHNLGLTADLLYDAGWRAPVIVAVPGLPAGGRAVLALVLVLAGACLVAARRRRPL